MPVVSVAVAGGTSTYSNMLIPQVQLHIQAKKMPS